MIDACCTLSFTSRAVSASLGGTGAAVTVCADKTPAGPSTAGPCEGSSRRGNYINGGTFDLTLLGETKSIAFDADSAAVKLALQAIPDAGTLDVSRASAVATTKAFADCAISLGHYDRSSC